jgi:hypothetical protein
MADFSVYGQPETPYNLTPEQLAEVQKSLASLQNFDFTKMGTNPFAVPNLIGGSDPVGTNPYRVFTAPLSNKGNPTSKLGGNQLVVYENQPVRLVDNRTKQVVFEGTGYEAAQKAIEMGQNLSNTLGRKAAWDIQTLDPSSNSYVNVANEKKNKSTLGKIASVAGTALPIAMIPLTMGASAPLAGLGTAGTIGLGAGVGAASAGLRGQNILKGAVMGGLTSAGGQFLSGPLKGVGLGADAARAVGTGLGATAGGLATGQGLESSLLGGVAAGGLTYLGGKLMGPSEDALARTIAENNQLAMSNLDAGLYNVGADAGTLLGAEYAGQGAFAPPGSPSVAPWPGGKPPSYPSSSSAGSEYVATAPTSTTGGGSFAVTPGASPKSDYTLTAKTDTTKLNEGSPVGGVLAVGGSNIDPEFSKDIEVEGTRETDTGTGAPPPTDLLDQIKDPKLKEELKDARDDDGKGGFGLKEALLALGLVGSAGGGGGGGGTGTAGTGKFQPIFSAKLPTPGEGGSLKVGGLKGPTKGAAGTFSARPVTDWYRFGMGPAMDIPAGTDLSGATSPYAGYGPGTLGEETFKVVSGIPEKPTGMSHGGTMGYARGSSRESFAVNGPGTGRSDDIPAVLSDGEYVIDAETVALLGDGSSKAGAKKLDEMRVNIRKHKGRNLAKGKFSVNARRPEKYLSGGRA